MIADLPALAAYLSACQETRETQLRCTLTPTFSARITDAALFNTLVTNLPMAQGIQPRILRSRGKGTIITANLRYRDGIRLLAYHQDGHGILSAEESSALDIACSIAAQALSCDTDEACFQHVYDWICRSIRYSHTAPGRVGYERLVGAAAVLTDRAANCQGFADVLYLLCGLCGIECQYRCGQGERRLHLWNAVRLKGIWQEVDVSRGARATPLPGSEDTEIPPC